MPEIAAQPFTCNQRRYQPRARPIAVLCLDGSADEYLDAALVRGAMPNLQRIVVRGHRGLARGALPSFTNVNNTSIITGVPPSIHGISGNFFYDASAGQEVMMNSAQYLRAETILAAAARAGRKVAVVTAKEKLRDIFAHGLVAQPSWPGNPGGMAFSSEKANQARKETHGIDNVEQIVEAPTPSIYSPEASLFVLWSGVALLERGWADFLYLSTTDYMQHKFPPDAAEVIAFYAALDRALGQLLETGAILGLTADHGMNAKQKPDGSPNVIYLESLLAKKFGPGFRVILPITDPYVVHHGALGSFAVIHLPSADPIRITDYGLPVTPHASRITPHAPHLTDLAEIQTWLSDLPGITEVYDRATAARKLELPPDRLGEFVVLSGRDVVIGRTPEYHNLKAIESGLRSHGGRYEEMVPFIISEPLKPEYAARAAADPRNYDIFDFTVNGSEIKLDDEETKGKL